MSSAGDVEMAPQGASAGPVVATGGPRRGGGTRGRSRPTRESDDGALLRSGDDDGDGMRRLSVKRFGRCRGDRGRAETASVLAALVIGVGVIGIQALCVYDRQCYASAQNAAVDPLVSRATLPSLLALIGVVAPVVSRAADAMHSFQALERQARSRQHRDDATRHAMQRHGRTILAAMTLAGAAAGALAITALVALNSADRGTYREHATRHWDDGTYSRLTLYYYDSPDGLASARYQLMTHVVYVCTAEALLLATAALLFGNDRFGRGCVVNGRDLCP